MKTKRKKSLTIEYTEPLKVHKGLVIRALLTNPEDLLKIMTDQCPFETAQEAIAALRADPREWFIDGLLKE